MRPVRIHFMDSPRSEAVAAKIEARADRLARFSDGIQNCEVWLESPHGHHRQGPVYGVRIRLTVPGEEITIERQPETDDVYVSIREAFDAARRKLEDHERRRRAQVKAHPRAPGDSSRRRRVLTDQEQETERPERADDPSAAERHGGTRARSSLSSGRTVNRT